jgi:uncharacterized membrane protein YgcG
VWQRAISTYIYPRGLVILYGLLRRRGGSGSGGSTGGCASSSASVGGGAPQRRRIDPSCLDRLHGDASLSQLRTLRNRWNDFCQLSQLSTYPANEQMAAFRMVLDPTMQQIVEVVLGISPATLLSPTDVLDQIHTDIRSKRNIALDHVAFEDCRQSTSETFDDFYIRLRGLAEAADLCITCSDTRLTTRIMAGIRDSETRRKLLALSPFLTLQHTINICRSEEAAKANEKSLSNPQVISHMQTRHQGPARQPYTSRCGSCGRLSHRAGEPCPAVGKQCHTCGNNIHFSPCCPKKPKTEPSDGGGAGSSGGSAAGGGASSSGGNKHGGGRPWAHMKRIVVGNVQANR